MNSSSTPRKKKVSTASATQRLQAVGESTETAGPGAGRSRSPAKSGDDANKPKSKQPSIATLMMLKKRIGDIRARQKRNRPTKKFENTYQMEPGPEKRYSDAEIGQILHNSLRFFLGESKYDARASPKLAKMISEDVKRRMKNNFNCPRYKIIVYVTVAQRTDQNLMMASRCVMDSGTDSFVSSTLERPTFVASASAHWFYCE